MLLIQLAEVIGVAILAFLVLVLFDIGGKYRLQLTYAITRDGIKEPKFSLIAGKRHIVLFFIVCVGTYINQNHIKDITLSVKFLLFLGVLYTIFLYRESLAEIKSQ